MNGLVIQSEKRLLPRIKSILLWKDTVVPQNQINEYLRLLRDRVGCRPVNNADDKSDDQQQYQG